MKRREFFILLGILVIAALLAFPLRDAVNQILVVPLAYLLWWLKIIYLSVDQLAWWIVLAVITLIILIQSLLTEFEPKVRLLRRDTRLRGSVETLAGTIQKIDRGIYFKWVVANRLGKLAHQFLSLREHGKPRSVWAPLISNGWQPSGEIQQYLEKGLHGSFADFPNSNWGYFFRRPKTVLDHDVAEVLDFLESNIETDKA